MSYSSYASMGDLPVEFRDALESERESGEKLLWAGRPTPMRAVRSEWAMFVFAIPWTVFALFWETMALGIGSHAPGGIGLVFPLFGLPFVGVGIGMLASPFLALRNAQRTIYAITDRRLLIIEQKGGGRKVHSYVPQSASDLERIERADGSGDLTFARTPVRRRNGVGYTSVGFWGVPEVRTIERIVRETFLTKNTESRDTGRYRTDLWSEETPQFLGR